MSFLEILWIQITVRHILYIKWKQILKSTAVIDKHTGPCQTPTVSFIILAYFHVVWWNDHIPVCCQVVGMWTQQAHADDLFGCPLALIQVTLSFFISGILLTLFTQNDTPVGERENHKNTCHRCTWKEEEFYPPHVYTIRRWCLNADRCNKPS